MKYLLFFFLLIASRNAFAQLNLVPNPSFEDTVYCPFGTNQIDACANWLNFGNSPDYFNACNPFGMSVPNSVFGFQYAHSGNAMAGIGTYRKKLSPNGPNYREFIGNALTLPCQIGTKYYLSFYTNWSGNLLMASNNIGLKLSTVPFDSCCKPPLNNFAIIRTDSVLADTLNWVRIQGSFIADSAYQYVMIGNFYVDSLTDTLTFAPFGFYDAAYYYVDDVCITTDSIFNQTWTSLPKYQKPVNYTIWPNPSNGTFYINSCLRQEDLILTDIMGRRIEFDIACLSNELTAVSIKSNCTSLFAILSISNRYHYYQTYKILLQP
jgi:hypothetical protein